MFVLGTKLRMMQGFTGDSDRLVKAAEAILSNTSQVLTTESEYQDASSDIAYFADMSGAGGGSLGNLQTNLTNALNAEVNFQSNVRGRLTMDALSSLAGAVSGYSGRKNLFWLAGNFPFRSGAATSAMIRYGLQITTRARFARRPLYCWLRRSLFIRSMRVECRPPA